MRVRFVYERRRYATMVKMRHGLVTLNSNNSVVYRQKHKVWVLVFLVRTSGTFWDQNLADLVKFSVLQQNRIVYSNSIHILSYQGLRLSNLTLGLTALIFSDWMRHKPKIVTINMINHKAVQKSINTRPPDKTAWLIYTQFSYLTTKIYV